MFNFRKGNQLWNEEFPTKSKIIKTAKTDSRKRDSFVLSKKYNFFYSPFMTNSVITSVAIFKRNTSENYTAIKKLNGKIKQAQSEFEIAALSATKAMYEADVAIKAGNISAQKVFNNAKHQYELRRCNAKNVINQTRTNAELEKGKIEDYANTLMGDCASALALYWEKVREHPNWNAHLGAMPPPVYELMEVARVYISQVDIDMTEIVDTPEYLELIGTPRQSSIPPELLDSNIRNTGLPRLVAANNDANTNNEGGAQQ